MKLPELTSDFKRINNLILKSCLPAIIQSAIHTGVFDALAEKELSGDELSSRTGINNNVAATLLDLLNASELVERQGDGFALAPVSREFLVSTSPAFQGGYLDHMLKMSANFALTLPENADNALEHNADTWAQKETMLMMAQMGKGGPLQESTSFISSLRGFSQMKKMCDLAGSHGYYAMTLLEKNPQLEGYVYDRPAVAKTAQTIIQDAGYGDRLEAVGFDMDTEENFGTDYDLVFVSNFLYEWGTDDRLAAFLKRVNRSLNSGGFFVSRHMTMDVGGDDYISQATLELITRLGGYPTHSLSEKVLTDALTAAGFVDFTVQYPEETSYDNTLTVAARKK